MKKLKKIISSPVFSIAAVAAAAGLLIFASISGARAVLNIESDDYYAHVELYDIGVSLLENGTRVAWRDYDEKAADGSWDETSGTDHVGALCRYLLDKDGDGKNDEDLKPGKAYPEAISVQNTGTINEFVRVTITKYWLDEKGNKTQVLDPGLIKLNLVNSSSWLVDSNASTPERTVLYYSRLLNSGEPTAALSDTLTIDGSVAGMTTQSTKQEVKNGKTYTTITTTYAYDGYQFCLEAQVDAVQEHNAQAAVKSAWGTNVVISGTTLSLR